MKTLAFVVLILALAGIALAEAAPATKPAESSPAPSTGPATQPAAKRATPVTIGGKADPRAPGYIILFENAVDAKTEVARLEKAYGFKAKYTYDIGTFKGFAATLPADVVEKLRWELSIKSIEHDATAGINSGGMKAE